MTRNLSPLHLADLRKSGLTDATIEQHRFESVRPCDIPRLIGYDLPGLASMYRLPFPIFKDGYERFKLFFHEGAGTWPNGDRKPKYIQRIGAANRLYIPVPVLPLLADTGAMLYITEGEKKSLSATQAGFPCLGITGLWNWKRAGAGLDTLIPDFDRIAWAGREVRLVPDNDFRDLDRHGRKKNLESAVTRLARCLMLRGATVKIAIIPKGGLAHGEE